MFQDFSEGLEIKEFSVVFYQTTPYIQLLKTHKHFCKGPIWRTPYKCNFHVTTIQINNINEDGHYVSTFSHFTKVKAKANVKYKQSCGIDLIWQIETI